MSALNSNALWDKSAAAQVADSPLAKQCFQWFTRERNWINEQHLQLCRIPAPTFLEAKRAEWITGQFRSLGYEAGLDRGGNVVAQVDPPSRNGLVALTAHLDTVLAPRLPEDIRLDLDGTLRGPGVSDNGAGLAGLLAVAAALRGAGAPAEVLAALLFVANVGEEGEGNLSGMRFLCRQSSLASRIQSFVVLDGPTTNHVTYQALASRRFEISFSGTGGHSWSDFGIGNPVHALSRAVSLFVEQV
ncbi:MAG TPA: M20/M25/M40 family metallo-hydrolase, partial [Bryobacteraceae bacterium]|nr:M20/M25/M40 family metallo-hydrolase [Bryobacteraceae bacterium]